MNQRLPCFLAADFFWNRRLRLSLLAVVAILALGARAGVLELKAPNPSATGMFGYFFGDTVGVPDLNGDRVGDLVVGGSYEDLEGVVNGEVRRVPGVERTYVFDGATGEVLYSIVSPTALSDYHTLLSDINAAGDVNHDGFEDLMGYSGSSGPGVLYFFNGRNGELLFELRSPSPVAICGNFGLGAHKLADVDGDGQVDWVVGEGRWGSGGSSRVYVFSGATREVIWFKSVSQMGSTGPHGLPDLNGDGAEDVAVDHSEGDAWVDGRRISKGGFVEILSGVDGSLLHQLVPPDLRPGDGFGRQIECAGDLDGDAVPDVVVGSQTAADGGKAWVFSGASGEWIRTLTQPVVDRNGGFGWEIEPLPDQTGDGVNDLWILAGGAARAYLFDGATGEVVETMESPVGGQFWITSTTDNDGATLGSWVFAQGKTGGNGRVYLVSERDFPTRLFIGPNGPDFQIGYIGDVAEYALEESLDLLEWTEVGRLDRQKDHHLADPADTKACFYRVRLVE